MKEDYLQKATDIHQYDANVVDWKKEGLNESPSRRFFQEYLKENLDVNNKTVLDVGSGMGQLFPFLKKLGATEIQGIEPSKNNVEVSNKLHPDIFVSEGSLESVSIDKKFDVVTSVMVFEHILDINRAFEKINQFLKPKGSFYLIVGDKKYNLTQRFDYELDVVELDNDTSVAKTVRPVGVLYDILRSLQSYINAGNNNGFSVEKHVELKPTEAFIQADPKYGQFKDIPICHLLIFSKN